MDDDVRAWLRQRGAERIPHPGGTLYAHLCRVSERLDRLGCGPDARLAGLTHAAYGTDGFDVTLLDHADRAVLRGLVGSPAEELVHRYAVCDRRRTWRDLPRTHAVVDRLTGESLPLAAGQVAPFVDVSIVNELDLVEHDPRVRERFGPYLREVFVSWEALASPAVAAEVTRVLPA